MITSKVQTTAFSFSFTYHWKWDCEQTTLEIAKRHSSVANIISNKEGTGKLTLFPRFSALSKTPKPCKKNPLWLYQWRTTFKLKPTNNQTLLLPLNSHKLLTFHTQNPQHSWNSLHPSLKSQPHPPHITITLSHLPSHPSQPKSASKPPNPQTPILEISEFWPSQSTHKSSPKTVPKDSSKSSQSAKEQPLRKRKCPRNVSYSDHR